MWRWHQVRELLSLDTFSSPHLCFPLLLAVLPQPCCPCHTLPVPCSPSPLSTGAVLPVQEASQDLLSPWSQERTASLSLPVSGLPAHRASLSTILELQAGPCPRSLDLWWAGNAPGVPGRGQELCLPSVLHPGPALPVLTPQQSTGKGNGSAALGWSREKALCGSLGAHCGCCDPTCAGREAAGSWGTGRSLKIYLSAFFPPFKCENFVFGLRGKLCRVLVPPVPTALV